MKKGVILLRKVEGVWMTL